MCMLSVISYNTFVISYTTYIKYAMLYTFSSFIQESKVKEITEAGENIEQCAKLGLLFDTEADFTKQQQNSILVQVFTKPVFGPKQDTFFLEVLERRGAKGFGAGNINALAQSIILYQQELEKRLF